MKELPEHAHERHAGLEGARDRGFAAEWSCIKVWLDFALCHALSALILLLTDHLIAITVWWLSSAAFRSDCSRFSFKGPCILSRPDNQFPLEDITWKC